MAFMGNTNGKVTKINDSDKTHGSVNQNNESASQTRPCLPVSSLSSDGVAMESSVDPCTGPVSEEEKQCSKKSSQETVDIGHVERGLTSSRNTEMARAGLTLPVQSLDSSEDQSMSVDTNPNQIVSDYELVNVNVIDRDTVQGAVCSEVSSTLSASVAGDKKSSSINKSIKSLKPDDSCNKVVKECSDVEITIGVANISNTCSKSGELKATLLAENKNTDIIAVTIPNDRSKTNNGRTVSLNSHRPASRKGTLKKCGSLFENNEESADDRSTSAVKEKVTGLANGIVSKPCEKCEENEVSLLVKQLTKDISDSDWAKTLIQILKLIRASHLTEKEHQDVIRTVIRCDFLHKIEVFMELHNICVLVEMKDIDNWKQRIWPSLKRMLMIIWIACDQNVNFCQYVLDSKVFLSFLTDLRTLSASPLKENDEFLFVVKAILGTLHNISRHVQNSKWALRNEGIVTIVRTFLSSEIPMVRLKSLMVLSYILSEAESEVINSNDDNFVFIFSVLSDALKSPEHKSSKYGMSVSEILRGINNLSMNDENKIRIVRNGGLPLYEQVLGNGSSEEKKITIMTLWSLAFHHYNKRKMREMQGIMKALYELQQCDEEEICHAARGTFWELENISRSAIGKSSSSSVSADKDPNQPHIMISYQWDSQPIMIKIKNRLRHAGYKVWMDVEHMTGSTLEAMALAVEKAAVVLVCMSQRYKDSPNCRTEAEYVYRLHKDFVPLRLQQEYVPDGWLGMLVGTRLYFDMYTEEMMEIQLPRLIKELRDRGKISPSTDDLDTRSIVPRRLISREAVPLLRQSPTGTNIASWSAGDVKDWMTSLGISDILVRLNDLDGLLLLELQKIQSDAPEYFYKMLRDDLNLSALLILKVSKAIRCLQP